jgi:hypothetical protein
MRQKRSLTAGWPKAAGDREAGTRPNGMATIVAFLWTSTSAFS